MKFLVSACLLGTPCRFDGCSKPNLELVTYLQGHTVIPICPEQAGGLPTPRPASERQGEVVRTQSGNDVTKEFTLGAQQALAIAKAQGAFVAILKQRSPSCGKGEIYDGTFSRTLTKADGVTAQLLCANGIEVIGETEAIRRFRQGSYAIEEDK